MNNHHFNEGVTLNVKDFKHWVYVYDTSDTTWGYDSDTTLANQKVLTVKYVGDNIYDGDYRYDWPVYDKNGAFTHLPWYEKIHHGDKPQDADHNAYEAWTWTEYDYLSQGQKAWRHNEYLTDAVWDYVYD